VGVSALNLQKMKQIGKRHAFGTIQCTPVLENRDNGEKLLKKRQGKRHTRQLHEEGGPARKGKKESMNQAQGRKKFVPYNLTHSLSRG